MKKLSEYKDEKALDLLADLIDPATKILSDPEIRSGLKGTKLELVKIIIKSHKAEIIEILAILDETPVEEYHINLFTLPAKLIDLLNDEDLISFFKSQSQLEAKNSSGSVTENTGERD